MKEYTDDDFNFRLPNNNSILNAKKKEATWTGYRCNVCRGSGSKPGSLPFVKCPFCRSSNIEKFDSNTTKGM
jgi:DnaJ-class molecular chaperone